MKKRVFGRKLSRGGGARKALFKSLTRALTLYGRIETTRAKGKAIIGEVEKLVSLARTTKNDRKIASFFGGDRKLTAVFLKLCRSFSDKKGGFVRIINLPSRKGDAAEMLRLEWAERTIEKKESEKENLPKKLTNKKESLKKAGNKKEKANKPKK